MGLSKLCRGTFFLDRRCQFDLHFFLIPATYLVNYCNEPIFFREPPTSSYRTLIFWTVGYCSNCSLGAGCRPGGELVGKRLSTFICFDFDSRINNRLVRVLESLICTSDGKPTYAAHCFYSLIIGKHLRHARDHFALLLNGMEEGVTPVRVSYDTRLRNTPMETSRSSAIQALQETIQRLRSLKIKNIDDELILDAITPYHQSLKTSVGREVSV